MPGSDGGEPPQARAPRLSGLTLATIVIITINVIAVIAIVIVIRVLVVIIVASRCSGAVFVVAPYLLRLLHHARQPVLGVHADSNF